MMEICQICWNENIDDSFTTLRCCPNMSYHSSCIKNWFEISSTCPFCRSDMKICNRRLLNDTDTQIDIPDEVRVSENIAIIIYTIVTIIIISLLYIYFEIYK